MGQSLQGGWSFPYLERKCHKVIKSLWGNKIILALSSGLTSTFQDPFFKSIPAIYLSRP